MIRHADGRGFTTTYAYDATDELTQTQDALGNRTTQAYDLAGNRTGSQDALGRLTTWPTTATTA